MATWLSYKNNQSKPLPTQGGFFKVPDFVFIVRHRESKALLMVGHTPFMESIKQARLRLSYYFSSVPYKHRSQPPCPHEPKGPFLSRDFDTIFVPLTLHEDRLYRYLVPEGPSRQLDEEFLKHYQTHGRPPLTWDRIS